MKYTFQDYENGRCELEEVGMDIPESPPDEDLSMASLVKNALAAVGGREAFEAEAKKNPTALFQAVLKMGVAQAAKHETVPPPQLDDLTDLDIQNMSTLDLKRVVLRRLGITKKSELGC